MGITTVRLQPDLESSLDALAESRQRSKSWLIAEALKEYIARESDADARWRETLEALESVRSGRTAPGEDVHEWLRSWGDLAEASAPKSGS